MNHKPRRERLRALLAERRCVRPASVFDPVSARIAEDLGFELGMLGGSVASVTVTGAPDLTGLTLSELALQCYRICRAGDLSLLVDADDGYGNALNVMRTVAELEAAGVAALTIEDTRLPQPYGLGGRVSLIPLEEGVAKMRAALVARSDPRLVIVGRTSAPEVTDLEDGIRRLRAYAEAGVDALFPIGVTKRAELEAVHAAVPDAALIVGVDSEELDDLDYLAGRGVRIAPHAHVSFSASVRAIYDTLRAFREGVPAWKLVGLADADLMKRVSRHATYEQWRKTFVR
jgi:carboxyvinyl-carboxyphosphonate phosphorylmutase